MPYWTQKFRVETWVEDIEKNDFFLFILGSIIISNIWKSIDFYLISFLNKLCFSLKLVHLLKSNIHIVS